MICKEENCFALYMKIDVRALFYYMYLKIGCVYSTKREKKRMFERLSYERK